MFEKIIITLLKSLSANVYIVIMLTLFSIPVVFIYQAVKPPVFTFESMSIEKVSADDEYLTSIGMNTDGWIKLNYSITADSGKFSPYSYEINEFGIEENEYTESIGEIPVLLDEPLSFSNTVTDSCTLSVYIEEDKISDIKTFAENIKFTATKFEKSFSEFSLKYGEEKN